MVWVLVALVTLGALWRGRCTLRLDVSAGGPDTIRFLEALGFVRT